MLQNAYLLAKIGADTAENEQHFAEILPKIGNYPTGRLTPWRRCEEPRLPHDARRARLGRARWGGTHGLPRPRVDSPAPSREFTYKKSMRHPPKIDPNVLKFDRFRSTFWRRFCNILPL